MRTDAATAAARSRVLAADKLMMNPRLYATFLLWLLSELFEELPEVGDPDKPKLVFFFDEAHLLFNDAPQALVRAHRAGGAADPLQGRRRLFRARRTRSTCRTTVLGPARQPRAARAARLYAARAEGGEDGRRDLPSPTRISTAPRSSPSSAPARRWSRRSKARARRRSVRAHADPPALRAASARLPKPSAASIMDRSARCSASMTRMSTANPPSRCSPARRQEGGRCRGGQARAGRGSRRAAAGRQTSGWTLPGFGGGNDDDNRAAGQAREPASGYQRETVVEAAMKSVARTVAYAGRPCAGARDFGELEAVAGIGLWEMQNGGPA